jgi:hypothetical protein
MASNQTNADDLGVRRKFKSLDEVIQADNVPAKHISYHAPPGE